MTSPSKDAVEDILFCTTTCGSQADPADGFGRCTCGNEAKRHQIELLLKQAENRGRVSEAAWWTKNYKNPMYAELLENRLKNVEPNLTKEDD